MSRVTFAIIAVSVFLTFALALLIPAGTLEAMADWAEKVTLDWTSQMGILGGDFSG